jgi:DNA-binding CsgD family transcriptional regulator
VRGDVPLVLFLRPDDAPSGRVTSVPPIELRILTLTAAGETTVATARAVGLSADDVTYHLTRPCLRFQVPNHTALIARAYTAGLLDPATWPPTAAPAPASAPTPAPLQPVIGRES